MVKFNSKIADLYEDVEYAGHGTPAKTTEQWLKTLRIAAKRCKINDDGTVDVEGDVNISYKKLDNIPIKFGKVSGHFDCSHNKLVSLDGSPREVGHIFWCSNNNLTSLDGAPDSVGDFHIRRNSKQFTEDEVRAVCDVKWHVYV